MRVQIDNLSIGYPVGNNMSEVKQLATEFARAFEKLELPGDKTVNLWCRGSSGAILASAFAVISKSTCQVCHVKKSGEDSHRRRPSYDSDGINVVIDDFVATGDTIRAILEGARKEGIIPTILMITNGARKFAEDFEHIICNC